MAGEKLTPAQRRVLKGLSDEWREEEADWRAGVVFLRLMDRGLCEMDDKRVSGGDVDCGPGCTSVWRWHTRITEAGRRALEDSSHE